MRNSLAPRDDKWYLGAGDGLVWAPPFPEWLAAPGFWDEAHLFQYAIRPLFTVTLLADGGAGLPPPPLAPPSQCLRRRWTPAALTLEHALGRLRAREVRSAPGGSLASEWEVRNPTERAVTLHVVVWTAVDGRVKSGAGSPTCGAIERAVAVTMPQSPVSGRMQFGTQGEQSALRG